MQDSVFDAALNLPCIHISLPGAQRNQLDEPLALDSTLHPWSRLLKDGEEVARAVDADDFIPLEEWETIVSRSQGNEEPHHWMIVADTPMWAAAWERKSPGIWVCVATGDGHADDESSFDFDQALQLALLAGKMPGNQTGNKLPENTPKPTP